MSETPSVPECAWWIAIHRMPRMGSTRIDALLHHFGSLSAAWAASDASLRDVLPPTSYEAFAAGRKAMDPATLYAEVVDAGLGVVVRIDDNYPLLLREVPAPPPILYYRGQLIETDTAAVAIVGTRKATRYGKDMAYRIAYDLAQAGVTIVSGLAAGIDGVAHRAALEAGGRTIAVLGSGIDVIYPGHHRELARRITEQGALVTEYIPGTPPDRFNFPARNRIISGLSRGVVVIEAPERSGALITVDFAAEQGRDAFAIPGPVGATNSAGCLRILREGATLVRNAEDILEDLHLGRISQDAQNAQMPLTDDERRLLSVLSSQPQHIDDLVAVIGKTVHEVSSELMMLELQGRVRNSGGGYYSRV